MQELSFKENECLEKNLRINDSFEYQIISG